MTGALEIPREYGSHRELQGEQKAGDFMEVRLAEYTGFCFGVKRAVDTVYEQIKNGKTI